MRLLTESIPSFAGGMNDSSAPDGYAPDQVQVLVNLRPSRKGKSLEPIKKPSLLRSGEINETGYDVSNCYGLAAFTTAAGVEQLVGFFDDQMHYSTDGGLTWAAASGATGLNENFWSTVIYREGSSNVLCCANGGTNSYQWDGTTWSTISNIPNNVKYLAVFGDRLIAAGHSGVDVAASNVGDIDTWANGWTVKATTHDGDTAITGLFVIGSSLMVFKRDSVGFIEGFGYQTLQVATGARGLSRSTGCVGFRTIAPVGDDGVMWLSERGFEFFQVGGRVTLVSANQQRFVDAISYDAIALYPGLPCAVWWPEKREYICSVPVAKPDRGSVASARNTWLWAARMDGALSAYTRYPLFGVGHGLVIDSNGELDFDTDRDSAVRGYLFSLNKYGELDPAKLPTPGLMVTTNNGELALVEDNSEYAPLGAPVAMAVGTVDGVPTLLSGTATNTVELFEDGVGAPNNAAVGNTVGIVRTRPLTFGDEYTRKKAKRMTVLASQEIPVTLLATSVTDGVVSTEHSLAFSANVGEEAAEKRARIGGRGRLIQAQVQTPGFFDYWSSEDFELHGISVSAAPMRDEP